jgi:uncharacterized surface protein with fasciclin (FAS1) repeats
MSLVLYCVRPKRGAFRLSLPIPWTLLNNDEFIPHLTDLLLYHVTTGRLFATNFKDDMILTALNGRPPSSSSHCRQRTRIVDADNDVSNGVVHIINGVLAKLGNA